MKRYLPLPLMAALVTSTALAQAPGPKAQPAAPTAPTPTASPDETPAPVPSPPPKSGAKATISRTKRAEANADNNVSSSTSGFGGARLFKGPGGALQVESDALLPRTTKTGRTLIVQSSELDPQALANAEEDLSVMGLILRRATGGSRAEERRIALGIEVDSTVFGSSSGARNLYLEGYGGLFLLGVRFPLVAPPDPSDDKEPKENASSEWEDARAEYLNGNQARYPIDSFLPGRNPRSAGEEYDPEKVEELRSALLQALKNASNIRVLKPVDFVTIVIQGAELPRGDRPTTRSRSRSETPRPTETVMTMRVRKADIDAFAKGTTDLEGFRKKVAIQTYLRRGDSSVGTAGFLNPLPH